MAKGCPPPDTCKATVGRDQMGGREIVGRSMSKQCCTKYTGQSMLHNE